jgi:hypothetical protein
VVGPEAPNIDAKGDRIVQGLVGVLLLTAFVFREPVIVPILAVLLGLGALRGPSANPFHRAYAAWLLPRLTADGGTVDPKTIRAQDAFAAITLAVASPAFVIGLAGIGWLLVLTEAVVAVLAATTMVHVGARVTERLFH